MSFRIVSGMTLTLLVVSAVLTFTGTAGGEITFRLLALFAHAICFGSVLFWMLAEPQAKEGQFRATVGIGGLAVALIVLFTFGVL